MILEVVFLLALISPALALVGFVIYYSWRYKRVRLDSYAGKRAMEKFIEVAKKKAEPGSEEMGKVRFIERNKGHAMSMKIDRTREPAKKAYEEYKKIKNMY